MTFTKQSKPTTTATRMMWRRPVVASVVASLVKADAIVAASHREGRVKTREVV